MSEPTRFAETNALLAVMRQDHEEAREILEGFLSGELTSLRRACYTLGELIREVRIEKQIEKAGQP